MSQAPRAPGAEPWQRLSPRMLLIHPVREVARFIPALVGLLFAGSSSGHGQWWSLGGVAIVLAVSVLRWLTTQYQISSEQVRLRTGLLRRRTISTPSDRVRTVDVTAHLLHRMLGLARVSIGTGISDRKKEPIVLDGLSTADAGRLRAELLHRARAGPPGGTMPADGPADGPAEGPAPTQASELDRFPAAGSVPAFPADGSVPAFPAAGSVPAFPAAGPLPSYEPAERVLAELRTSWVRYAPFTLSGALTALALAGFGWRIIDQTQVDAGRVGAIRVAARHLRDTPAWLDAVQAAVAVLVLISLLSVIGYVLAFWNFRLTRHPGGSLQTSRGLVTSRTTSIEERRLRGVELSEPLLLRAVGGARLVAVATGLRVGRGAERGGSLLLPPCPAGQAYRTAAAVLDDPAALAGPLRSHGPIARRRRLVRAVLPWLVLTIALVLARVVGLLPAWAALSSLLPLAAGGLLGLDRYRSLGHVRTPRYLQLRYGSMVRRRVLLEHDGIIGWNLQQSFWQRRAGVLSLTATTAAGRQAYRITDLEATAAVDLADRTVPGLLTDFLTAQPDALASPAELR